MHRLTILTACLAVFGCAELQTGGLETISQPIREGQRYLHGATEGHVRISGSRDCSGTLLTNSLVLTAANCVEGMLDDTYDGDGKVLFDAGPAVEVWDVAVDRWGRTVVVGGRDGQMFAARLLRDGSVDGNFGTNGTAGVSFSSATFEVAEAVAIDDSDRIVLGGWAVYRGEYVFALARLTDSGALDRSFDGDGKVLTTFGTTATEGITDLVIDEDERIVVAGPADEYFAMARYLEDGSLDRSFDGDGKVLQRHPDWSTGSRADRSGWSVALADPQVDRRFPFPLAKVVLARDHSQSVWNSSGWFLAGTTGREQTATTIINIHDYGRLVSGFGWKSQQFGWSMRNSRVAAITVDDQGHALVSGHGETRYDRKRFGLLRADRDARTGEASADWRTSVGFPSCEHAVATSVAYSNGYTYLGGLADCGEDRGKRRFALARYRPDGRLDPLFAGTGRVLTDFRSRSSEYISGMGVDPQGNLVVAGLGNHDLAAARYLSPRHMVDVDATVHMGNQTQRATRMWLQGDVNAAILKLASPMSVNGSTRNYNRRISAADPATLDGKSVHCYGFGNDATLRHAALEVMDLDRFPEFTHKIIVGGARPTPSFEAGDTGGACFYNGEIASVNQAWPYEGVHSTAFRDWAKGLVLLSRYLGL